MIAGLQFLAHVAAPAVLTVAVTAGPSAGIQGGAVCMPTTVHAGSTYSFPPVVVADTGPGTETVGLTVQEDPGGKGRPVDPAWLHIGPPVKLGASTKGSVRVTLTVPADAPRGPYTGWLIAAPADNATPGHASFAGKGIADLEFTVNSPRRAVRTVACANPAAVPAADSAPSSSGGVSGGELLAGGAAIVVVVFLVRRRRHT